MKKLIIAFFMLLFASIAMAAGGEAHGDGHIPWGTIQKQIFNFILVFGGLAFVLRSKVKAYYSSRAESFEKNAVVAKKAKEDAENQMREIHSRLEKLESGRTASVEQAKKDAEALKEKMQAEALALAKQLREDAEATAKNEVEKIKHELRDEFLSYALSHTREQLKQTVQEQDQKRLQNEFVDKIQVVR